MPFEKFLSKEYHKEAAKMHLERARDTNLNWEPMEHLKKNKPHRLIAAKMGAVMFNLERADNHLKIALGKKPVFSNFNVDGVEVGAIYAK